MKPRLHRSSLARLLLVALLALTLSTRGEARGFCFEEAGAAQGVDPILLRALAAQESSCGANNYNRNATSEDHGPMQINDSWLRDHKFRQQGVNLHDLYDPCTANYIASYLMADCYKQFGVTWRAVGCYNAKTYSKQIQYANKIYNRIQRYRKTGKGIC